MAGWMSKLLRTGDTPSVEGIQAGQEAALARGPRPLTMEPLVPPSNQGPLPLSLDRQVVRRIGDKTTMEAPALRSATLSDPGSSDVARVLLQSLLAEVIRRDNMGDSGDRQLRRDLTEIIYDMQHGIGPLSADAAARKLGRELPAWFQRCREAENRRSDELSDLISVLGQGLRSIQEEDGRFYEGLGEKLGELDRIAADDSRQTRQRIRRMAHDASRALEVERAAHARRVRTMGGQIQNLQRELETSRLQLREDALTGLYDRSTFDQYLEIQLRKLRISPHLSSLILIELDGFSDINERFGHAAGDRTLQACAKAIREVVLRKSDFAARFTGRRFVVMLDDCDAEDAGRVADRICQRIEALRLSASAGLVRPTASFGVAEGCKSDTNEDLIARADKALYIAGRRGTGQVVVAGAGDGRRVRLPDALLRRRKGH